MKIKGYITNLGKYAEGELVGKWVAFPVDDEELEQVFEEIGINEQYEEFFFTDWECDFEHGFGEYESIEDINKIAEQIEEWDEYTFNAACEYWGAKYIIGKDPDNYILYPDINDDYDLGYHWAVDSGCYDLSSMGSLSNYFDYESFGRDIRFETDGGFTSYGWIEYRG